MKMSSARVRCKSVPSRELSTLILHRDTGITDPERPFKHECLCGRWFTALDWHLHGCWTGSECQYDEPPSILHEYERFLAYDLLCEALGQVGVLAPIRYKHPSRMGRGRGKSCVVCSYTANADVNAARNILKRGLDTLAVTSENLWGADGTPVEQGRKTNGNAARESVALS